MERRKFHFCAGLFNSGTMELSLAKTEQAEFMNTYAKLLYKAGKRNEAIAMEEKAVTNSGGSEELKTILDKMKQGVSTWD